MKACGSEMTKSTSFATVSPEELAAPVAPCRLQILHHEVPLKAVAQLSIIVAGAHP